MTGGTDSRQLRSGGVAAEVQYVSIDGRYTRRATPTEHEDMSSSLQQACLVIDRLAGRYSAEERDVVRRTGLLPDWFWPAYRTEFAALKRR